MGRRRPWWIVAGVVTIVLAAAYAGWSALGRPSGDDRGWLSSLDRVQGDWVSTTGSARDGSTPWTAPVRLTIRGDELAFNAGCNQLSARVKVEDHRLRSDQGVTSTLIGCPPEAAARDAWLAALVDDRASVQLSGSTEGPMLMFDTDAGWIGFLRG